MTSFNEFKRFPYCIQARWEQLSYPATEVVITATCKYMYGCRNSKVYLERKVILAPNQTSFTFTDLAPGSLCDFTLKAVYNPASLDNGISVPYMVLPASKTFVIKQ